MRSPSPAERQDQARRTSAIKSEVANIGRKSLVYVGGRALSQAVGFFMIPVYTRFIVPGNYGAMDLIDIISGIAMMIIWMGASDSMSRFYYGEKDERRRDEVVSTIILGLGLLAVPVILVFQLLAVPLADFVLEDASYARYFLVAFSTVWFGMLCETAFTYLRMRYMAKTFVLVTTAQLVMGLTLNIWFVVFVRLDILGIFLSALITQAIVGTVLSLAILGHVGWRISPGLLRELVMFGLPLVPARITQFLIMVSNRLFLRWLATPDPTYALTLVGLYSLGNKFGVVVSRFINAPFNSFWGPRRMELLLSEDREARATAARICTYAIMLSTYAALGLSAGIRSLILIVADPLYAGAHVVVPMVALGYVMLALDWHFSTGIIFVRKTVWMTVASVVTLAVVIGWNYLFVPRWGLLGAASSNLAGFAVRASLSYVISSRLYPIPFELGRIVQLLLTAVLLYALCQMVRTDHVWLTFMLQTGLAATYPLVLMAEGFYRPEELRGMQTLARRIFQMRAE